MIKKIDIYAHRGGAGLLPENTIPAYLAALSLGVDVLDIDVVMTKDNIVVAYHDIFLNPDYTRDANGWTVDQTLIRDLSLAELKMLDVGFVNKENAYGQRFFAQVPVPGTRIATLKEVISVVKSRLGGNVRLQIEMKSNPHLPNASPNHAVFAQAVFDILKAESMLSQSEVHSFDWGNLLALQSLSSELTTTYISSFQDLKKTHADRAAVVDSVSDYNLEDFNHSVPALICYLGGKGWCPDYADVTVENVSEAHEQGLRVVPWTVDKEGDMLRMIDCGVDGIITNRPDILRGMLAARGYPLPSSR